MGLFALGAIGMLARRRRRARWTSGLPRSCHSFTFTPSESAPPHSAGLID